MSGNVTWEGAKLDLDWFHDIGVGGVGAFSGGSLEKAYVLHPLTFMSPAWSEVYRKSLLLAKHYDMDFMIAGSAGWSETGGPWVAPADAMKKYTWSETVVDGGQHASIQLAAPPSVTGPLQAIEQGHSLPAYRGIPEAHGGGLVIAFPAPTSSPLPAADYSSSAGPLPRLAHLPFNLSEFVSFPLDGQGGSYLDISLKTRATVGGLRIAATLLPAFTLRCLDCSTKAQVLIRYLPGDHETPAMEQTVTFAPVTASQFKITFDLPRPEPRLPGLPAEYRAQPPTTSLTLRQVRLLGPGYVDRFEAKAGFQDSPYPYPMLAPRDSVRNEAIPMGSVIDLSHRLRSDGLLDWSPPPGRWIVIRFGWSLIGSINEPAEPLATGLEVDKLDAAAVKDYIDTLFSMYRDRVHASFGPGGINELFTDSWEVGPQNWTPGLLHDFERLRGYDPMPWLPVLAGYIVRDAQSSDAFLADYRQTLKDLVVQNHYDVLEAAAHRNGMTYYTEDQGDTPRAIADGLTVKAQSDVPTGELWFRPYNAEPGQPALVTDLREAASAAHVYGKRLAAAESFTEAAGEDPWNVSPASLKLKADEEFGLGINRILIHESHLQPFVNKKPGLELGFYGVPFNRNETWANDAKPFIDYVSRSSFLLQQGYAVADIAYLYGEERNLTEIFHHTFNQDVPRGYNYDYVNAQGLIAHMHMKGGKLFSDSGNEERIVYLSRYATRLHLDTLRTIASLVQDGATLVGLRPVGMLGMGQAVDEFNTLCDKLWGSTREGTAVLPVGKGKVYPTLDLGSVLLTEGLLPDVVIPPTYDVLFQHRRTENSDIYYVVSQARTAQNGWFLFRMSGKAPELWSAEDGQIHALSYRMAGDETAVHLPLYPHQAVFVVFSEKTDVRSYTVPDATVIKTVQVATPWRVFFEAGRGAPAFVRMDSLQDWAASSRPGIRYFSGTAAYHSSFVIRDQDLHGQSIWLNLGDVKALADVSINGKSAGTLWHPPYSVEVTKLVRKGHNSLEVKVTNLWVNRLIGDKQPNSIQYTYAPQSPYNANSPLEPSGLLGPVHIVEFSEIDKQNRAERIKQ